MSHPVTLLMAIHCHQPVGNFGFVLEEAYAKAYDPFLRTLERHPDVRMALHYSGCLLEWLEERRPEFLDRVRVLVARGQVELLASGYDEPILPLIPEADRQGQIALMRETLRRRFGAQATGLWLTERVWEPDLPASLSKAGIRHTVVDTNQFLPARSWLPSELQVDEGGFWDVLGSYTTEYAGSSVRLFPASKRLRYSMPFKPVGDTIEFLKRLQRDQPSAITFGDDGEKFGLWPNTFHWVHEEGWLEQFFAALERERSWLKTETFADYLEHAVPDGRVYLPCGSYDEMLEWSGGHFRNFFAKYPEANAMQQKMLHVSRQLQTVSSRKSQVSSSRRRLKLLEQARDKLYAGQCNCAYWHGVFGGLYLSHLRRAVYANLLEAEDLMHQAASLPGSVIADDADGDGQEEAVIRTRTLSVVLDPEESGSLTEWSVYPARLNLLDTLTRRPEPYHETIRAKSLEAVSVGSGHAAPKSIHDLLGVKESDLASRIVYDDHRRTAFLDYALDEMPTLDEAIRSSLGSKRRWPSGPWVWERGGRRRASRSLDVSLSRVLEGGIIRKTVRAAASQPTLECLYEHEGVEIPVVGLEWNLAIRDERYLKEPAELDDVSRFRLEEPELGVSLTLLVDPPARLMHFPIETVSESEEGLERTYQGLCLLCLWTPQTPASWKSRLVWTAEVR